MDTIEHLNTTDLLRRQAPTNMGGNTHTQIYVRDTIEHLNTPMEKKKIISKCIMKKIKASCR